MKIAINQCFGGFSVNESVFKELGKDWDGYGYPENQMFGIESDNYYAWRANKDLIAAIEKIGEKEAGRQVSNINIIEIPEGVEWELHNNDGVESIHECHRSWPL